MANDFALVGSALMGRLGTVQYTYTTNSGTAITGSVNVYNMMAPQETHPPYIVFQHAASGDEYAFGARGESLDYIVKVVSNRAYPGAQAYPIYATAHNHLQDAPLSITGATLLRCRRQSRFEYRDEKGYSHTGGIYRIDYWD